MYRFILFVLSIILFTACESPEFISTSFSDPAFKPGMIGSNAKVAIISNGVVDLENFVKTFEDKYKNKDTFTKLFMVKLVDTTKYLFKLDEKPIIDIIHKRDTEVSSEEFLKKATELQSDYLIAIRQVMIDNYLVQRAPPATGSDESCKISITVSVFEVSSGKKLVTYTARGEEGVFLMFFEKALTGALNRAIFNTINYIKTGKKN